MAKELFAGPSGSIEVRMHQPDDANSSTHKQRHTWVVLCHPHPQFGGTMDNKVITTLEKSFQAKGYATLAFNFRGVGLSEGEYDGGQGEQDDLLAVVKCLKTDYAMEKLILAGFSFGGYVAAKTHAALNAEGLCLVAPAVSLYDFSDIRVEIPWMLIQGGEDEVIPAQEVMDWAWKQPAMPDLYWRAQASHFFHRQLVWLKQVIALSY